MAKACIILTGGDPPHPAVRAVLPQPALVIAADSGLDHAEAIGLPVDLVVGDLDSVSEKALERARRAGVIIDEHPADKDQTDFELALAAAIDHGADHLVVVSGGGGRLDHLLAGAVALAVPAAAGVVVEAYIGPAWLAAVAGPGRVSIDGRPGELVTLLALGGEAGGVCTTGLRYPLRDEALQPGSGRGVSNELVDPPATVSVASGSLLLIRPDALEVLC